MDQSKNCSKVTIVIVNYNSLRHLRVLLPSLFQQTYTNYDVLIVDNASTDASLDYVEDHFPAAQVIRNGRNCGYAAANNVGFRAATGEYIAVLNPDTWVDPAWLSELVDALARDPRAGLATPKIVMMDDPGQLNACGNEITMTGLTFCRGLAESSAKYQQLESVSAVSGAAFVIKCNVLDAIGDFDESFFMYYEDTDLSLLRVTCRLQMPLRSDFDCAARIRF